MSNIEHVIIPPLGDAPGDREDSSVAEAETLRRITAHVLWEPHGLYYCVARELCNSLRAGSNVVVRSEYVHHSTGYKMGQTFRAYFLMCFLFPPVLLKLSGTLR